MLMQHLLAVHAGHAGVKSSKQYLQVGQHLARIPNSKHRARTSSTPCKPLTPHPLPRAAAHTTHTHTCRGRKQAWSRGTKKLSSESGPSALSVSVCLCVCALQPQGASACLDQDLSQSLLSIHPLFS